MSAAPYDSDDDWPEISSASSTDSDDSDTLDAIPTLPLNFDNPRQLCEQSCGACDVLRAFERVNDRTASPDVVREQALVEYSWPSRRALRCDAQRCSFCAYLVDRSKHANLFTIRRTKGFLESKIRLSLAKTPERTTQTSSHAERDLYDLQFDEQGHRVVLAFAWHSDSNVYAGIRQVSPQFDAAIGREWLARCRADHTHGLNVDESNPAALPVVQPGKWTFRTIRTSDHCIVEHALGEARPPYAALSYVWGALPQLTLTRNNRESLMRRGGLLGPGIDLPVGVQDAIAAATSLGFDHLWVDALCIIQDDDIDKAQQIGSMRAIYAQAAVTIVSTASSVHFGIPGVQSVGRPTMQQPFETDRFILIDRLPGMYKMMDYCEWLTRGWTLQEYLLSQRLVIYTEAQVIFMCQSGAVWYEDTILVPDMTTDTGGLAAHREPAAPVRDPEGRNKDYVHLIGSTSSAHVKYHNLLSDYQDRKLRYAEDNLNAVTGIMDTIGDHIWGLPRFFFTDALCWTAEQPYTEPGFKSEGAMKPLAIFPSWSWVAWKSPGTVLQNVTGRDRSVGSVEMFSVGLREDGTPYHAIVKCLKKSTSCDSTKSCVTHQDETAILQANLLQSPRLIDLIVTRPPHSVLRFRGQITRLFVAAMPTPVPGAVGELYDVYADSSMTTKLTDVILDQAWRPLQGDSLHFLFVGVRVDDRRMCLLIEWDGEVAYRRPSVIYLKPDVKRWQSTMVTFA